MKIDFRTLEFYFRFRFGFAGPPRPLNGLDGFQMSSMSPACLGWSLHVLDHPSKILRAKSFQKKNSRLKNSRAKNSREKILNPEIS